MITNEIVYKIITIKKGRDGISYYVIQISVDLRKSLYIICDTDFC